jgi:hypothetical protein
MSFDALPTLPLTHALSILIVALTDSRIVMNWSTDTSTVSENDSAVYRVS